MFHTRLGHVFFYQLKSAAVENIKKKILRFDGARRHSQASREAAPAGPGNVGRRVQGWV